MSRKKKKQAGPALFYIPGWLYRSAGYILTGIISVVGGAWAGWKMYGEAGLGSALFWGFVVFASAWAAFWISYRTAARRKAKRR